MQMLAKSSIPARIRDGKTYSKHFGVEWIEAVFPNVIIDPIFKV